jgi:hypothetical protein
MATLRYVTELLAEFPDNVSSLIVPVNVRDFIISYVKGIGFIEDTTSFNIPITDGVPTAVNPLLTAPISTTELWGVDGNSFLHSNYSVLGDTVPAGYTKLANFVSVLALTKSGGGADNYFVSFTKNGVQIGLDEDLQYTASGSQVITVLLSQLVAVDVESDVYGIEITGNGTTDDLTCTYFSMQVSDNVLLSDPTP